MHFESTFKVCIRCSHVPAFTRTTKELFAGISFPNSPIRKQSLGSLLGLCLGTGSHWELLTLGVESWSSDSTNLKPDPTGTFVPRSPGLWTLLMQILGAAPASWEHTQLISRCPAVAARLDYRPSKTDSLTPSFHAIFCNNNYLQNVRISTYREESNRFQNK